MSTTRSCKVSSGEVSTVHSSGICVHTRLWGEEDGEEGGWGGGRMGRREDGEEGG